MICNILEVRINDEIFGIDSEKISHVLKVPPITPLALSDESILGVSVVLGRIVNIIDISVLLNIKRDEINEQTSILNISNDNAIVVDEVLDMVDIKPEDYEEVKDDFLLGFYKYQDKIIQILDIDKILKQIPQKKFNPKNLEMIAQKEKIIKNNSEEIRVLFFRLEKEMFCLDISLVKEIITTPKITPNNNPMQIGLMNLRGKVIPIIDLKKLFGFKSNITSNIVILHSKESMLGIMVDEIDDVRDIELNLIDKIEDEKVCGIFKGENIASFISYEYLKELLKTHNINDKLEDIKKGDFKMIEIVVFKIEDEEFAFNINLVQEIIKYQKPTYFPQAPNFVEGLLNLRGSVIPIISLPKKLGFKQKITENTKIIVCNVFDEKVGFVVDDVSDIMFVKDDDLSKVEKEDSIFDEVINLDDRVIFKIDIENIFNDKEVESIKLTKANNNG